MQQLVAWLTALAEKPNAEAIAYKSGKTTGKLIVKILCTLSRL